MAIRPDWTVGTLTLSAGSKDFTTTGAAMVSAAVQAGDEIITASGDILIIEAISTDNAGTLYQPCPATAAGIEQPLRIRFQPDGSRYSAAARELVHQLGSGNIYALSGLLGDVDKVPYFTAPGAMGLIDLASLAGGGSGGWDALVGTLAGRDAYNGEPAGFRVMVADNGNGQAVIYEKTGAGAADWSDPVYFTGPSGTPGDAGVEFGITIKYAEGMGPSFIGEYPATRSTRSSGIVSRFFGEVVAGDGGLLVQVLINGSPIDVAWFVASGAPLTVTDLNVTISQGDAVSFVILAISGAPTLAWFQID